MAKIATDNLLPGMVLAADVRDRSGRLLLKDGTELTERHLYILRTWGVVEAEVAGAEEDEGSPVDTEAFDPERWAILEEEITPFFRLADLSHPVIRELLRIRIAQEARHGRP